MKKKPTKKRGRDTTSSPKSLKSKQTVRKKIKKKPTKKRSVLKNVKKRLSKTIAKQKRRILKTVK